ncbi:hypothetical protein ACLB6G_18715 [Zhengella sp. ZM62]
MIKVFFAQAPTLTKGSDDNGLVGSAAQDGFPLCIGDATQRKPGAGPGL